ncbi:MAG: carboxylating nicotinate-nucleotide diphosphorylase [Candidatus Zixiibacteriota bacterium]|nr:MAG: carboxylating nicotinate-nucleotide diphosphorylase [candidate division Zixibacteria bacterium]
MLALVKMALEEDIGAGDLTTLACLEPDPITAKIFAKCDGILSGTKPALLAFEVVDSANDVKFLIDDGTPFKRGDTVAEIDGFNQTVLVSERVALNFLGHLSGIATLTRQYVDRMRSSGDERAARCQILDTRKTTPGWRLLEKAAVKHGGGVNHRLGLYDMVLIKENHIRTAGSIAEAVRRTREYLSTADFRLQFKTSADEISIEVEVIDESQLREAIAADVNHLLLDNQSEESLRKLSTVARELNPEIKLEASGNVTLDNIAAIASTGVDYVSIGALTHSAPVADFSMLIT